MKKQKVHYAVVLDESGSMDALKHSVIQLFNEQIQRLQKQSKKNDLKVTVTTFNDRAKIINLNTPIDEVQLLNTSNYRPDSCTALYDAIVITYKKLKNHIKKEDRVVLLILTDGAENASEKYSKSDVQELIAKIEKDGGSFKFLCSALDVDTYKKDMNMINQSTTVSFDEHFSLDFESILLAVDDDLAC